MPLATTTGTVKADSNTGPVEGNSAHTDTVRAVPSSAAEVGETVKATEEGFVSLSPKVTWAPATVKAPSAPPTSRASVSPATLSSATVSKNVPGVADLRVPAPITTLKVLSVME